MLQHSAAVKDALTQRGFLTTEKVNTGCFFYSLTVSFFEKRHLFYSFLKTLLRSCSERVVCHKKPSMGIYVCMYLLSGEAHLTIIKQYKQFLHK